MKANKDRQLPLLPDLKDEGDAAPARSRRSAALQLAPPELKEEGDGAPSEVVGNGQSVVPASSNGNGARRRATVQSMAASQRDISISEFFAKNRHLLGFDNPRKALLTTVKEAVDNALDACEEAGILPEVWVHIEGAGEGRFKVGVQDRDPGSSKSRSPWSSASSSMAPSSTACG